VHLIWKRKVDLRLFTTTGGMPSSHAAGVMGLSTTVGLICGFSSIEFAMAVGYALVVMYDAAGVRRAAGLHAREINRMRKILDKLDDETIERLDEEVDIEINPNDCRIDVFRSSGNGGQCVNTTDSAVRLTHIPTGIVISCQDEKSQLKNRDKAFKVLRSKLYELELEKAHDAEAAARKSQVGSGDRSEKIRTYNFPQGRVTDHRINLTTYNLDAVMNGDLQKFVDSLIAADQAAKLAAMAEEN